MNDDSTSQSNGWSVVYGLLLLIAGCIVLSSLVFTSYATAAFFGWMLIITGMIQFLNGFVTKNSMLLFVSYMGGITSIVIGLMMLTIPKITIGTIALLIGILLLTGGVYSIFTSIFQRFKNWGWSFTGGIISFFLGFLVFSGWPAAGIWIMSFYIGIEVLTVGILIITSVSRANKVEAKEERFAEGTPYLSGVKGGSAKKEGEENKK